MRLINQFLGRLRLRPAAPSNLTVGWGNPPKPGVKLHVIVLGWRQNQTRSGTTYYDIHVTDGGGAAVKGMWVTGGAGQPSKAGGFGEFSWKNPPELDVYNFSVLARTKSGTDGCVSAASAPVRFTTSRNEWQ